MKLLYQLLLAGSLLFSGCASEPLSPPPIVPPTVIQLQIVVENDVNPGNFGEPSPVMLRIYELRETSSFNAADFFGLFNDDKAALGGDLLHKNELIVKPGDIKQLEIQPSDSIQSLGVLAAFRKLDTAQWRNSLTIKPHQTQAIALKLSRNQLALEFQD